MAFPAVGFLLRALHWLFKNKIGLWVAGAFAWIGLSFGTYKIVIQPAIDQLEAFAGQQGGSGEYAAMALAWMGVLNFDKALTAIIGAVSTRAGIQSGRAFLKLRAPGA
jgi:hypothetical protein